MRKGRYIWSLALSLTFVISTLEITANSYSQISEQAESTEVQQKPTGRTSADYDHFKETVKEDQSFQIIKTGRHFIQKYKDTDLSEVEIRHLGYFNLQVGNAYLKVKEYGLAMDYYHKALSNYKKIDRIKSILTCQHNIALVYQVTGQYKSALEIHEKTLPILKETKHRDLTLTYNNVARLYIHENNFTLGRLYLDSAINFSKEWDQMMWEGYAYRNLGYLFEEMDLLDSAVKYYSRSLEIHSLDSVHNMTLESAILLSSTHLESGNPALSLEISLKYEALAQQIKSYNFLKQISDNIFNAYIDLEEYRSAFAVIDRSKYIDDTLAQRRIENEALMAQLRAESANEVELLQKQDQLNNQTIRFQNTLLAIAIAAVILVIIVAVFIYRGLVINKRLSNLNRQQSERLRQLDAAKSRFFANISHDLRTPLSLIMGSIEQVLQNENIYLDEKADRQLKTGLINGQRIIHLTNEINELIKLEDSNLKIEKSIINIDQMLSLFVSMFGSMAEMKSIKLSYVKKIFSPSPYVSIDVKQFEKVLFNLITNALKHTQKDDFVTVSLDLLENDKIEISVIDSGEGIPEENVPYIFERYYQSPSTTFKTQEGFGIGLALVKEIIDKHSAHISVKSKQGQGSQFTILLDLEHDVEESKVAKLHSLDYSHETREIFKDIEEAEASDKPVVSSDMSSGTEKKQHTLLIVEDHPEIRQYIQDLVEPYYNILTANNGKRALKVLDGNKEVDLIITDLMMPWFDGFELLEKLKENEKLSNIPVLVLSARTSEEDKERVLSQGVNDFLYKPFNAKELLARIKNLLERKSKWNNNASDALFINNTKTLSDIEKSLLEKVDHMIMSRIDDANLSVADLANEIAVSERKFFRMIKKLTDSTPFEYIKEIRLQYINRLIREKKIKTSSEAAKHIGMNNVSHFNQQFKSRFGKKPADLLK